MKLNGSNLLYCGPYPSFVQYFSAAAGALDLQNIVIVSDYLPTISAFKVHPIFTCPFARLPF